MEWLAVLGDSVMAQHMQQLGIDAWSSDDRLQLLEEIWDSLSHELPTEIPESHRAELDRRMAAAKADPSAAIPWEDVMARLRSREGREES